MIKLETSLLSWKHMNSFGNITNNLTPGGQMAFWTPFFPFGLKWKPLLRRHVMISLRTFAPETKTMGSSFTKNNYIFNIFYHFITFEPRISEVWKGKNLVGKFDMKLKSSGLNCKFRLKMESVWWTLKVLI